MFVSTVVAAFVALPFVAQSALATTCTRTYTVQQGDWCDTISAAHNVSTYQLAVVNAGKIDQTCSNLIPGEQLCLGTEGQDCTQTYVVQPDDTCEDIANNHRVNSTIFFLNNPQLNPDSDNLYIGEVVCVASTAVAPSLPSGAPLPASTPPPGAAPAKTPVPSPVPSSSFVGVVSTSPTPAPTPKPAPAPSPKPSPVDNDDDDDDDCDDDDDNNDDDVDDEDLPFCDE